ncbi:MAG: anhydro-N-acetylmuramic acid kinase [Alphaproteobacteria bacterium]|nr:anhydro-N-acetylmuramic acid kinase [Alphaproteobacteria bacterium]
MSGTSLDGVDAALLETDGGAHAEPLGVFFAPYSDAFRSDLRRAIAGDIDPGTLEVELTDLHADAVAHLLQTTGRKAVDIDLIGFHGQTVAHDPANGRTWQIGDGQRLADATGIPTAFDFRTADVAAGGEGAPLAPIYHVAIAASVPERPIAILNIGGVANITWIGARGALIACDTGPGNGPLDDWMQTHTNHLVDQDGGFARTGHIDQSRVKQALAADFFSNAAPKSLDRLDFTMAMADGLSPRDGTATLTEITVAAIAQSIEILPEPPKRWLVTGGGRLNSWMMERLAANLEAPVDPIEAIGRDGDNLEAEAFAYLAVRTKAGLPISFPGTTGAPSPMTGGRIAYPSPPKTGSYLAVEASSASPSASSASSSGGANSSASSSRRLST